MIREVRPANATSLHQIADALNVRGITTPRGGKWYAKSVSNVLAHASSDKIRLFHSPNMANAALRQPGGVLLSIGCSVAFWSERFRNSAAGQSRNLP